MVVSSLGVSGSTFDGDATSPTPDVLLVTTWRVAFISSPAVEGTCRM